MVDENNNHKPLLDLSTIEPERPFVRIDGIDYPMALPEDLDLIQIAKLERLELDRLALVERANEPDYIEERAEAMHIMLEQLIPVILPTLPGDVLVSLRDPLKMQIMSAFTKAVKARRPAPQNRAERRRKPQ